MSKRPPPPRATPPPRPTLRELGEAPAPSSAPAVPSAKFYSEPPTKQKNVVASVYQSLLSVFDEMTAEQRMEFVDLASRYGTLEAGSRHDLLEVAQAFGSLDGSTRAAVLELARRLAAQR